MVNPEEGEKLQAMLNVTDLSMVLCSSSEDKTVRVWCATRGVELKCVKSPGTGQSLSSARKSGQNSQSVAKINYTPLCWPSSRYLISGSFK